MRIVARLQSADIYRTRHAPSAGMQDTDTPKTLLSTHPYPACSGGNRQRFLEASLKQRVATLTRARMSPTNDKR